ncbi:MAG TPA: TonB family protein [Terriglobales bacterium]
MGAQAWSTESGWAQWQGRLVGNRYRLGRCLGESDRSAVFVSARNQTEVAIKLQITDPTESDKVLGRWRRAAGLSHPHLVRIYEVGQDRTADAAVCYAVVELAEENLAQILPQRPLSAAEAKDLLQQILDTLTYLLENGFAHTALRPTNVLAKGDHIKLSGEDVVEIGSEQGRQKQSVYDAPEAGPSSAAGQMWSLGVTLYQSLTQQLPVVSEETPQMAMRLPTPFQDIVEHCLIKDPAKRWSISDVSRALLPSTETVRSSLQAPGTSVRKRAPLRLLTIAMGAIFLLVITLVAVRNKTQTPASEPTVQSTAKNPAGARASESAPGPPAETKPEAASAVVSTTGSVLHEVNPVVPASARRTIEGTVRVRVKVDADAEGNVIKARLVSAGPSAYFARLAEQAARGWKFTPPQVEGKNLASAWTIQFEFRRSGTQARAEMAR